METREGGKRNRLGLQKQPENLKQKKELENENRREIGRERENDDALCLISGVNRSSICYGGGREGEREA